MVKGCSCSVRGVMLPGPGHVCAPSSVCARKGLSCTGAAEKSLRPPGAATVGTRCTKALSADRREPVSAAQLLEGDLETIVDQGCCKSQC